MPGPRFTCRARVGSVSIPTSGLFAGEGHLPLSCTPEPASAAPITGTVDACEVDFIHEMSVSRIWEAPRVTKPYTEDEWPAIERLGHAVDADLRTHDVRLTMGGEPTFVSIDDPDGDEWNTAALGPNKKRVGGRSLSSDAAALRRPRPGSLRSRQVVSGRATAALVAQLLLAQGRRTDLARRVADRR